MTNSTRQALNRFDDHLSESVGARSSDTVPQLSPVANVRDIGRKPNRRFGRLAIDRIIPDPQQPRTEFDVEQLQHLSDSLNDRGQLAPIRVRWSEHNQAYVIISGERRWRAAKAAALAEVDCYFVDDELTRSEIIEEQLIENMIRADLKPIEEAKSFQELMEINAWGQRELARRLRVSPARINRALALLNLTPELQRRVEANEVSARAGYELSKLDSERQAQVLRDTDGERISNAEASRIASVDAALATAKRLSRKLTFESDNGIRIAVTLSVDRNYHDVEAALEQALEEVRLRLDQNVQL